MSQNTNTTGTVGWIWLPMRTTPILTRQRVVVPMKWFVVVLPEPPRIRCGITAEGPL